MADDLYQARFDRDVSVPGIGRVGNKELPNNEQPSAVAWGSSGLRAHACWQVHLWMRVARRSTCDSACGTARWEVVERLCLRSPMRTLVCQSRVPTHGVVHERK
eukprot:14151313-Alexandrium_andersonii.AAC.1